MNDLPFRGTSQTQLVSSVTATPSTLTFPPMTRDGSFRIMNLGTTYAVTAILYDSTSTVAPGAIGTPIAPGQTLILYRGQNINNMILSVGVNSAGTTGASGPIYVTPGVGGL